MEIWSATKMTLQELPKRMSRPLQSGRPVEQVARTNRERLLECFAEWLAGKGENFPSLLELSYREPEKMVTQLVSYGRELYASGRPYNHYVETVNAVAAAKPTIRRLLTGAWDLAFSWQREEPGGHHLACPFQILLAILSVSILWGWPWVAGSIALSWGAICRIGEVLQSCRRDLVLPQDVGYTSCSIFLRVKEPKTRFKAARHQMSKLDPEDLVQLVSLAFGSKRADEKLWPFSGQLLRTRFRQILREIGLPYDSNGINRGLDLGSLRGGGATYLLMLTEDSELVRRRGRWIAPRTMEVYLQEIAATVYFPQLPSALKARVLALASAFPGLLARMQVLVKAKVPAESWHYFFSTE